jgi:hypothetical protein
MRLRRAREPWPAHPAGREATRVRARHVRGERAPHAHAVPEREDDQDRGHSADCACERGAGGRERTEHAQMMNTIASWLVRQLRVPVSTSV